MARDAPAQNTRRVAAALAIATTVTLAAAIPLGAIAWNARDTGPAPTDGLVIEISGEVRGLNGFVLRAGTDALLHVDDPDLVGVSWVLYLGDDRVIARGQVVGSAPFLLEIAGGGTAALAAGSYDLLVTGTERDGNIVERAATFVIGDAQ